MEKKPLHASPLEFFDMFFDEKVFELLRSNTEKMPLTRYTSRLTIEEVNNFIGIYFCLVIIVHHVTGCTGIRALTIIIQKLSRNRFFVFSMHVLTVIYLLMTYLGKCDHFGI